MPFAQIYMIEGRTAEQKKAVIEKVTQALVKAVGAPKENLRVWIHDRPRHSRAAELDSTSSRESALGRSAA